MIAPIENLDASMLCSNFWKLVSSAQQTGQVVTQELDDGLTLFAFPNETNVLLGLGRYGIHAVSGRAEQLLRQRSAYPERFGKWVACTFADGGWFLVARHAWPDEQAELHDAIEQTVAEIATMLN